MKRTSPVVLVLGALLGAAATGFLVVMLVGEEGGPRSSQGNVSRRTGALDTPRRGTDTVPGVRSGEIRTKDGGILAGSAQARRVFDSPEMLRARAQKSGRVVDILDEMMRAKSQDRMKLNGELQKLIRELGHRVDPHVRETLLEMLVSVEPRWRNQVGQTLGYLQGDTEAANALITLIKSKPENVYTRYAIYNALAMINVPEVSPQLVALLREGHQDEYRIISTLGSIGRPQDMKLLLGMLDKSIRQRTRTEIEKQLRAHFRQPGLLDAAAAKLATADPASRRSIVSVLGVSGNPVHAKAVRQLLEAETDERVRDAGIRSLGRFGDIESANVLLRLTERGTEMERRRAAAALRYVKNGATLDALVKDWGGLSKPSRLAILGAVSSLPKPSDLQNKLAREEGLRDAEMRVRLAGAKVLGRAGRDDNVNALGEFIAGAKRQSEWNAGLRSLQRIATKKSAETALSLLHVVPDKKRREIFRQQFEQIRQRARK